MKPKKVVLGIDPGLGRMGYAVVSGTISSPQLMAVGCIETSSQLKHGERLVALSQAVQKLLRRHRPSVVTIERLYFSKNVKTALAVAEARGAIVLEIARSGRNL
ncbi:MAG: crossover junction endodeoxyribonuclease RuvC, partial [Candidatus Veblenbacteria bacterium]|nr:crossover junction endodeoxyribonuclease RuvC [Candidatus Veblenbacteria bacterium]